VEAPIDVARAVEAVAAVPRGPPCLWFTRAPLRELCEEIRVRHFGRRAGGLRLQFAVQDELAESEEQGGALLLSIHQVLNHRHTPPEVFGTLCKRALWRQQRRAAGRSASAVAPGFYAICPEEPFVEAWLDHHLGACLRRAEEGREPRVTHRWRPLWMAARATTPVLSLKRALADAELYRLLRRQG
jgi:hypothetical protein